MKPWDRWREWLAARRWKKFPAESNGGYTPLKPEPPGRTTSPAEESGGGGTPQKWLPFGSRDRQLAVLQAGYDEIIGLVRGIREHLEQQNQAQQELMKSLERFNQTLTQVDRAQRDSAADMRSLLERSEKRWAMVTAVLAVLLAALLGGALYLAVLLRGSLAQPDEGSSASVATTVQPPAEAPPPTPSVPALEFPEQRETPPEETPAGEQAPAPVLPEPGDPPAGEDNDGSAADGGAAAAVD